MRYTKSYGYLDGRTIIAAISVVGAASRCRGQAAVGDPSAANGWNASSAIVVTASSSDSSSYIPENTVLGDDNSADPDLFDPSGQFVEGPQSTDTPAYAPSAWISGTLAQSAENPDPTGITSYSHWIEFSFNQSYSLGEMWIWNGNQDSAAYDYDDQGMQDVTIQYSDNGTTWNTISTSPIPEATSLGAPTNYSPVSQIVNFGGAQVKDVVITGAATNYTYWPGQTNQNAAPSAVRFYAPNEAPVSVPAPLPPPPTRPFYYGYYYPETTLYGNYMDQVVIPATASNPYGTHLYDYTNLALILDDTRYGSADPHRTVVDAANLGYKVVVYGAGFTASDPSSWTAGFEQLQQAISGYQQYVYALDLVDEPDLNGWTRSQEEALASAAESYFGGTVPITMNLGNPSNGQVPNNLNVYMFDDYINGGGTTTSFASYTSKMNADLNGIRSVESGKNILILGDSYSGGGASMPSNQQEEWYYDTAVTNSDVNGLMWFMLPNAPSTSPPLTGAISSPSTLAFQALLGQQVMPVQPGLVLDEHFDEYANQAALNAAYSGVTPTLTSAMDHGNNAGKSVEFGNGSDNATRQISAGNELGSVSAFMYDNLTNFGQYLGFRALNAQGQSIAVYANGATDDWYVVDQANNVTSFDTGTATVSNDWQKVQFSFNGSGVGVYLDSLLVYQAASGWSGGYSQIGFYDPGGQTNPGGFIDDITAYQTSTFKGPPAWGGNVSGDWNNTGNWTTLTVPNGVGAEADMFGGITNNQTVYTNSPITLGTLNFDNANTYEISGTSSLTLQASAGNSAEVIVQNGTHEIDLPTTLASNTIFNVAAGANLTIANPLTIDSGVTLTQTGAGTVTYESIIDVQSNASVAFAGAAQADELSVSFGASANQRHRRRRNHASERPCQRRNR